MCHLRVLLLWVLLCPGTGNGVQEEFYNRPGSDLLLPIRRQVILSHTDRCDRIYWSYWKYTGKTEEVSAYWTGIADHVNCKLTDRKYFPNTRISEDGSLIISNVTLENAGGYNVDIYNSTGHNIQTDYYTVHVEGNVPGVPEIFTWPGSDLLLPIRRRLTLNHTERCDYFYWYYKTPSEHWQIIAIHRNCNTTDHRHFPNTRISENGSLIISNVTLDNDGIYIVNIYNSTGHNIWTDYYSVHVEGKVLSIQEEIFTRPGSDLLLPVRSHLTLEHTRRCDRFYWYYEKSPGTWEIIADHRNCKLTDLRYFPNTRISENGSLIISNVTLDNDRRYNVYLYNSIGKLIQRDYYSVHVEVTVLVPVPHVSCLRNGSAEISCRVETKTKPNIHLSVNGGSQGNYSTSANNITVIVEPPGPWDITCSVENGVSWSEESRAVVTCPVPVSVPVLDVSCFRNGSVEISCRVEAGTKLNIHLSMIGGSQRNFSTSYNNIKVIVEPPGPWDITCTVENGVSRSENNRDGVTCPEESRSGMWSGWGHLLTHGVMFVLNTGLLIFIVIDLRKMKNEKNEKNRSESRVRRKDQMEMETEPTYYDDRN